MHTEKQWINKCNCNCCIFFLHRANIVVLKFDRAELEKALNICCNIIVAADATQNVYSAYIVAMLTLIQRYNMPMLKLETRHLNLLMFIFSHFHNAFLAFQVCRDRATIPVQILLLPCAPRLFVRQILIIRHTRGGWHGLPKSTTLEQRKFKAKHWNYTSIWKQNARASLSILCFFSALKQFFFSWDIKPRSTAARGELTENEKKTFNI